MMMAHDFAACGATLFPPLPSERRRHSVALSAVIARRRRQGGVRCGEAAGDCYLRSPPVDIHCYARAAARPSCLRGCAALLSVTAIETLRDLYASLRAPCARPRQARSVGLPSIRRLWHGVARALSFRDGGPRACGRSGRRFSLVGAVLAPYKILRSRVCPSRASGAGALVSPLERRRQHLPHLGRDQASLELPLVDGSVFR